MFSVEDLGMGCKALISKEHSFTTDTFLLAYFSRPQKKDFCLDIGTGCGVIPLLWRSRIGVERISAIEIQTEAAEMARESFLKNGFDDIELICGDVRDCPVFKNESFDLIACNPPYYPMGSGKRGEGGRAVARSDETLSINDIAAFSRRALKFGGRLCVCLPTERLSEAMCSLSRFGLEPKRLRLVQSSPEKEPYLFLLECRKGGRPGLKAEKNFIISNDGACSAEANEMYGGSWR